MSRMPIAECLKKGNKKGIDPVLKLTMQMLNKSSMIPYKSERY